MTTNVPPPQPHGALPSARQLAWHTMEFNGFIHFTVNTFTDKRYLNAKVMVGLKLSEPALPILPRLDPRAGMWQCLPHA